MVKSILHLNYKLTRYQGLMLSFEVELVIRLDYPLKGEETSQLVLHQACHSRKPGTDETVNGQQKSYLQVIIVIEHI